MKLPIIVCALVTVTAAAPGLLRVPKVYNAVITSNQNLSPSRAFPVIQPVVHRTAVGYVPPFYYTQIAPRVIRPEVVRYPMTGDVKLASRTDQAQAPSASRPAESTSFGIAKERKEENITDRTSEESPGVDSKDAPTRNEQAPLSFYPNYHSVYYEPYIYSYNSFNPHLVPGTYYIDYQPYGSLEPIPPTAPKNVDSGALLPSFYDERRDRTKNKKEEIPDVPPPPLPTSVPKRS